MLPLILGGAALGAWHWWKQKHPSKPPVLTPARVAVHGELMRNEIRPNALEKMSRLFGAEGLTTQAATLATKAREVRKQAAGARELIERARACDQNAMGIIAAVREAAAGGDLRAQTSCRLMLKYCELHPMGQLGPLGEMPAEVGCDDPGQAFQHAQVHGYITSPFGGC